MLSRIYHQRPGLLLLMACAGGLLIGLALFAAGWAPWYVMLIGAAAPLVAVVALGLLFTLLWMGSGSH